MEQTSQLVALRSKPGVFLRSVSDRLRELEECGFYLVREKISGKDIYGGFVLSVFRDACRPFELYEGGHEVMACRKFLDINHDFVLGRRWEYTPKKGNDVLLAYLSGRISEEELEGLKNSQFQGNKAEVKVGNGVIGVSKGEGGLVYEADFEAHRIIRHGLFKVSVWDFLVPSCKYVTRDKFEGINGFDTEVGFDPTLWGLDNLIL